MGGVPTGLFSVNRVNFYLDEKKWRKIDEFQNFKPILKSEKIPTVEELNKLSSLSEINNKIDEFLDNSEEMRALIEAAGNRSLWEFNATLADVSLENATPVRNVVALSQVSIGIHKQSYEVKRDLLEIVAVLLNFWSRNFGANKAYRERQLV